MAWNGYPNENAKVRMPRAGERLSPSQFRATLRSLIRLWRLDAESAIFSEPREVALPKEGADDRRRQDEWLRAQLAAGLHARARAVLQVDLDALSAMERDPADRLAFLNSDLERNVFATERSVAFCADKQVASTTRMGSRSTPTIADMPLTDSTAVRQPLFADGPVSLHRRPDLDYRAQLLAESRDLSMPGGRVSYGVFNSGMNLVGAIGELAVLEAFKVQGFNARHTAENWGESDITIDIGLSRLRIEVKSFRGKGSYLNVPQLLSSRNDAVVFCRVLDDHVEIRGWLSESQVVEYSELGLSKRGSLSLRCRSDANPLKSISGQVAHGDSPLGEPKRARQQFRCRVCGWTTPLRSCANCFAAGLGLLGPILDSNREYHRPRCRRVPDDARQIEVPAALERSNPCKACMLDEVVALGRSADSLFDL